MHAYAPLCTQCFSIVCTYTFAINIKIMIPTISFYVFKNRRNQRGEVKVYLRFTNDRKSNYKSTNVSVPFNMWDEKKQKVKSTFKLSNPTNMLLERKLSEVREELMHSALRNKHIPIPTNPYVIAILYILTS